MFGLGLAGGSDEGGPGAGREGGIGRRGRRTWNAIVTPMHPPRITPPNHAGASQATASDANTNTRIEIGSAYRVHAGGAGPSAARSLTVRTYANRA